MSSGWQTSRLPSSRGLQRGRHRSQVDRRCSSLRTALLHQNKFAGSIPTYTLPYLIVLPWWIPESFLVAIRFMTAKWQADLEKAFPTYRNRPGRVKSCRTLQCGSNLG